MITMDRDRHAIIVDCVEIRVLDSVHIRKVVFVYCSPYFEIVLAHASN